MIGLLLLTHEHIGRGLLAAAEHTLGERPARIEVLEADYRRPPEQCGEHIAAALTRLDDGDGVLILADVYGATHTNLACRQLIRGRIELITGLNLPMLLKALNYRGLPMDDVMDKALAGGCGGIVCAGKSDSYRETAP